MKGKGIILLWLTLYAIAPAFATYQNNWIGTLEAGGYRYTPNFPFGLNETGMLGITEQKDNPQVWILPLESRTPQLIWEAKGSPFQPFALGQSGEVYGSSGRVPFPAILQTDGTVSQLVMPFQMMGTLSALSCPDAYAGTLQDNPANNPPSGQIYVYQRIGFSQLIGRPNEHYAVVTGDSDGIVTYNGYNRPSDPHIRAYYWIFDDYPSPVPMPTKTTASFATAINGKTIVGWYSNGSWKRPFRWHVGDPNIQDLGPSDLSQNGAALGLDQAGNAVGWLGTSFEPGLDSDATLFPASGKPVNLNNLPSLGRVGGDHLTTAQFINGHGVIAGTGWYITDTTMSFVLRPLQAYRLGDVNGDGLIDPSDVIRILEMSIGKVTPTQQEFQAADVNGDGKVNLSDALELLRQLLQP